MSDDSGVAVEDTTSPNVTPDVSGTSTLDASLQFEVDVLVTSSLSKIAGRIAEAVSEHIKSSNSNSLVLIATSESIRMASRLRIATAELNALLASLRAHMTNRVTPERSESANYESDLGPVFEPISSGLAAAASVLQYFRVDSSWFGRSSDVSSALVPLVAGHLMDNDVPVSLFVVGSGHSVNSSPFLRDLQELLSRRFQLERLVGGLEDAPTEAREDAWKMGAVAFISAVDRWTNAVLLAPAESQPPMDLPMAASFCAAMDDPRSLLLVAEVVSLGGHYRVRRHFFSSLFGNGGLTYSGGAIVSYRLEDPRSASLRLSDTLYHRVGDVAFSGPGKETFPSSNLNHRTPLKKRPKDTLHAEHNNMSQANSDDDRTPNGADDEAAGRPGRVAPESDGFEAAVPWRVAAALLRLRTQINNLLPNRSKLSDGAIGDAEHASRSSDHNPWIMDGNKGVVTAVDITHDPAGGFSAARFAESLRLAKDSRLKYLIWDRQIANAQAVEGAQPWAWRPYKGSNAHEHHIHISVKSAKEMYDDQSDWTFKT